MLKVNFDKSVWLRIRNEYSAHGQKLDLLGADQNERGLWGQKMGFAVDESSVVKSKENYGALEIVLIYVQMF